MRIALLLLLTLAGAVFAGEEPRPAADLLADLDNPNYQIRRKAVLAVAGRAEPELFEKVLAMAAEDSHPNIRSYCADVLGTFRDDRIHPLLVAMTKEKWSGPRSSAYVALGRQGKPESYEFLVAGLEDKSSRSGAARGLGLLGDLRAWDPILTVWQANPRDGYLVDMAPRALLALDRERAIALFLSMFKAQETGRYTLARILREHPAAAVRDEMTGFLDVEDDRLRTAAIHVLGKAGNGRTVDALIASLGKREEDSPVLVRALAELGDRKAAGPLAGLLGKEDDPVGRVVLFGALADLGDPRAIASIASCLDDGTHTAQPREISSVWQYPYNVVVCAAAVWAIRALLDGEEPFDRNSLCSFPNPPSVDPHGKEHVAVTAWWKEHRDDPKYRFEQPIPVRTHSNLNSTPR